MFKLDEAFYRPLWIRITIVAVCLGWAGFEFSLGNSPWAVGFAGIGVYAAYRFFITFNPPPDDKETEQ